MPIIPLEQVKSLQTTPIFTFWRDLSSSGATFTSIGGPTLPIYLVNAIANRSNAFRFAGQQQENGIISNTNIQMTGDGSTVTIFAVLSNTNISAIGTIGVIFGLNFNFYPSGNPFEFSVRQGFTMTYSFFAFPDYGNYAEPTVYLRNGLPEVIGIQYAGQTTRYQQYASNIPTGVATANKLDQATGTTTTTESYDSACTVAGANTQTPGYSAYWAGDINLLCFKNGALTTTEYNDMMNFCINRAK